MSNGSANCLLTVCCDEPAARKKFAEILAADANISREYAEKCAGWVYDHFDLAEKGTLVALKKSIARLARENP